LIAERFGRTAGEGRLRAGSDIVNVNVFWLHFLWFWRDWSGIEIVVYLRRRDIILRNEFVAITI
jgi:hypothetical protein